MAGESEVPYSTYLTRPAYPRVVPGLAFLALLCLPRLATLAFLSCSVPSSRIYLTLNRDPNLP